MELPYHTKDKIRRDLLQERIDVSQAMEKCLVEWSNKEREKATLNRLKVVFENSELLDFSRVISEKFINSQDDKMISSKPTEDLEEIIEKQTKHLEKNLKKLSKLCRCSPLFLATMTSHGIINDEDSQEVVCKQI